MEYYDFGGYTQNLIYRLAKQGHPEAGPLEPDEVPALVARLRQRLGDDGTQLDQSPASLKRLERLLPALHADLAARGAKLSDDDLARLVRELTAYVGSVLVLHLGGQWHQDAPSLMRTSVTFEGPFEIIKDRQYTSPEGIKFVLGWGAAIIWDKIMEGEPVELHKTYREARSRRVKEQ